MLAKILPTPHAVPSLCLSLAWYAVLFNFMWSCLWIGGIMAYAYQSHFHQLLAWACVSEYFPLAVSKSWVKMPYWNLFLCVLNLKFSLQKKTPLLIQRRFMKGGENKTEVRAVLKALKRKKSKASSLVKSQGLNGICGWFLLSSQDFYFQEHVAKHKW